jgi:hypothetical protein
MGSPQECVIGEKRAVVMSDERVFDGDEESPARGQWIYKLQRATDIWTKFRKLNPFNSSSALKTPLRPHTIA